MDNSFVNKAKEGGYVRIILLGSNIQFSINTEKEQIKKNLGKRVKNQNPDMYNTV